MLSIGPSCHNPIPVLRNSTSDPRMSWITVSCQNRDFKAKTKKEMKEDKGLLILQQLLGGVEKVGKGVKDSLSPKHKGDWKDITLMSLSFAVYVYMSQKIVCAYCAWISMLN